MISRGGFAYCFVVMKRTKDLMLFNAPADAHVFRGLLLFLYVYVGASLFASVFTPLAFWLVEWVNANCPCELSQYLVKKKIDVYYDRLRWAPIIVALPFILRACGLLSFKNLGISARPAALKNFAKFWLGGAAAVGAIFAVQAVFMGVRLKPETAVVSAALSALAGSLILGFLEEVVFRGLLLRCVYTAIGGISGVVLSSLFFAYKHFKVPDQIWNVLPDGGHSAHWYSGFTVCYYDTIGIYYDFALVPFLSLFVLACVLCVFYIRTKTLMSPIGFHAGAVFGLMFFGKLFEIVSRENEFIFGNEWITNGCVGLGALTAVLLVAIFGFKNADLKKN